MGCCIVCLWLIVCYCNFVTWRSKVMLLFSDSFPDNATVILLKYEGVYSLKKKSKWIEIFVYDTTILSIHKSGFTFFASSSFFFGCTMSLPLFYWMKRSLGLFFPWKTAWMLCLFTQQRRNSFSRLVYDLIPWTLGG